MPRAFIPLPNGIQVLIRYQLFGQQTMNRYFVQAHTSPTPTLIEQVATDYLTFLTSGWMGILSSDIQLIDVTATDWDTNDGFQFEVSPTGPHFGGRESPSVGNVQAAVGILKTAHRGRSFMGRTFIAGIPTNSLSDPNTLSTTAQAELDSFLVDLPGHGNQDNYDLVIASFYSGVDPVTHKPIPRTTGVGTVVQNISVDRVLGVQRRRKPGVGI